jgi:hypothetical protein
MSFAAAAALFLALGLVAQPALAGVNEAEPRLPVTGADATLLPDAQASDEGMLNGRKDPAPAPIVVADDKKYKNNKNKNKNWSKNYKYNKNYVVTKKVYVKPWYRKPHYGEFFGGVVLGSILTAGAIGVAPVAPSPELCWYWVDPYRSRGYWDYCPPPY